MEARASGTEESRLWPGLRVGERPSAPIEAARPLGFHSGEAHFRYQGRGHAAGGRSCCDHGASLYLPWTFLLRAPVAGGICDGFRRGPAHACDMVREPIRRLTDPRAEHTVATKELS
jgi:hypothetical protein